MRRMLQAVVVLGGVVALCPAIWRLADVGRTNEYAGHAMFVPLFSALIAWSDRERLRAAAGAGHIAGAPVLAAGLLLAWLGTTWNSDVVQATAVMTTAAGAVLWLYGPACLRAAAFPVGFLLMMAPLPRPVVAAVTAQLQTFAAGFAARALHLLGVPVFHVGANLELARLTLQVAEVCNGLRFLMAILVLTAAFAQITLPSWPRKVILIASAIPIAIVANAMRVAAIGLGVHYIGPQAASGTIHDWIGKSVWVVTLAPMIALGIGLARFRRPSRRASATFEAVATRKAEIA